MARGHARSSLVSTAVDFAVMLLAVELFHIKPALATVCGTATMVAIFVSVAWNFPLQRHFVFTKGAKT